MLCRCYGAELGRENYGYCWRDRGGGAYFEFARSSISRALMSATPETGGVMHAGALSNEIDIFNLRLMKTVEFSSCQSRWAGRPVGIPAALDVSARPSE